MVLDTAADEKRRPVLTRMEGEQKFRPIFLDRASTSDFAAFCSTVQTRLKCPQDISFFYFDADGDKVELDGDDAFQCFLSGPKLKLEVAMRRGEPAPVHAPAPISSPPSATHTSDDSSDASPLRRMQSAPPTWRKHELESNISPPPSARSGSEEEGLRCFIKREGGDDRLRHIPIAPNIPYAELLHRVKVKLGEENLVLHFFDQDGDKVDLDSDDAMKLFFSQNGKLKVHATPTAPPSLHRTSTVPSMQKHKTPPPPQQRSDAFALVRELAGHDDPVYACAITSDGTVAVTGGKDRVIRVWDVATGDCHPLTGHENYVLTVHIQGELLVSGSYDKLAIIWDIKRLRRVCTLRHNDKVYDAKFSPDGAHVATACCDKLARIFRVADGTLMHTLVGHTDGVLCVAYANTSQTLCSGSDDTTLRLWDAASGSLLSTLSGHHCTVWSCAFSHDDELLVSAAHSVEALVWDVATGAVLRRLCGHRSYAVHRVAFLTSRVLLTCGRDWSITLWDLSRSEDKQMVGKNTGHSDIVYCVAAGGSRWAISSSADKTAKVWELTYPALK
eukprot:Sspe_Gene.22129::Locus_8375_Transcript_1_2_Confidence_0.750_Length_2141::g.22129::m.22129